MSKILEAIKTALVDGKATANLKEAATLTGGGSGIGGTVQPDSVFAALRHANPMRQGARQILTNGSDALFVAKVGNAADQANPFGYTFTPNAGTPSTASAIWQLPMRAITAQLPIRTSALADIGGLEETLVSDLALEFSAIEGQSCVSNNDQAGSVTTTSGGTSGLRGLNFYPSAASAAFGSSGSAITNGLHSIATVTQAGAAIAYDDLVSLASALPAVYWNMPSTAWMIHPTTISAIRKLKSTGGAPFFFEAGDGDGGALAFMFGLPVVPNPYLDLQGSTKFPVYLACWDSFMTIVDSEEMTIQRFDQTQPGFLTLFAEKRVATSVRDVFAGARLTF